VVEKIVMPKSVKNRRRVIVAMAAVAVAVLVAVAVVGVAVHRLAKYLLVEKVVVMRQKEAKKKQ
jgi:hypothetical protein